MKCYLGIDLGSTTTKAVILDEEAHIIGRGITNSRSNYDVACDIARTEAYIDARFGLLRKRSQGLVDSEELFIRLERAFRLEQYLMQLRSLIKTMKESAEEPRFKQDASSLYEFINFFEPKAMEYGERIYLGDEAPGSDFFRDIANATYTQAAEDYCSETHFPYDKLTGLFDRSIILVENETFEFGFPEKIKLAYDRLFSKEDPHPELFKAIEASRSEELVEDNAAGTGYGRLRLPFAKEQIRSEILCHGLGANYMFPGTRTVLDIGGQDTKGIQVDPSGIVTSFQMNDRCAAGCGRYLGYIAEEMNIPLPELGPMAMQAKKAVKINSTCTVFAGAELRDRLADGQKREDIMMGLHRAIIYRALSLLSRSGGISNEFTFTGGVAKNEAAVKALRSLVDENYGKDIKINIAPDSIFTGALGASLFAHRDMTQKKAG